jgi:lipopolysaccharide transport system ATP-binding protein
MSSESSFAVYSLEIRILPMPDEVSIKVEKLSKCYPIFDKPRDRLKQMILPRLAEMVGKQGQQHYREFWALKDVSFSVGRGEAVGIIGRNGSGKSTLLQIICGTLSPTSGSVTCSGRIAALLELGSGFNPEFTGRENVYLNGALFGASREEIDERFDQIAAFADIGSFIDQPVKTYSSGMAVRLAFAVAIHVDPEILVVDEALAVGDEMFQRKCFSRIEAIRSSGATILFVSHSGALVIELCDRALLLDGGRRLLMGQPKHVVGRYQKLLYAPVWKRDGLLQETLTEDQGQLDATASETSSDKASETHAEASQIALPDSFDPLLKPTSTIAYESRGALIENPAILSADGEMVNNLTRGKTYLYRYRVRFTSLCTNVRFGMLIKTISGLELGGAGSAPHLGTGLPVAESGSVFEVSFEFNCRLNAGVYFMNAGVSGDADGARIFLHRLIDVVMFRVKYEEASLCSAIVDFSCVPNIKQVPS